MRKLRAGDDGRNSLAWEDSPWTGRQTLWKTR